MKNKLPSETLEMYKKSKELFGKWKNNGCDSNDHVKTELLKAKRAVRLSQRQFATEARLTLYAEIAKASSTYTKLFYKLVNKQRQWDTQKLTSTLVVNGSSLQTEDDIRDGWAEYFRTSAHLSPHPTLTRNITSTSRPKLLLPK